MIVLDTCALVFDALAPDRLSKAALKAIDSGERQRNLACCDISLWEIAMLVSKGRLDPGTDAATFITLALSARLIEVLPITPEIAALSASHKTFLHYDPADRLIAASTLHHKAALVTCDRLLRGAKELKAVW